jgi:hypothetical protein
MDGGEEVSGGFVIAGCDGAILFEPAIEILHEVAGFVEFLVERPLGFPVAFGRNDGGNSGCEQRLDHTLIGIEGFIGEKRAGFQLGQQFVGAIEIMRLAASQKEGDRIAQSIDHGVDFGAQSASAAPDRLIFTRFF